MNDTILNDILKVQDVTAVILVGGDGRPMASSVTGSDFDLQAVEGGHWSAMSHTFNGFKEAEFVYENHRIFIKKAPAGLLVVVMGRFAPIAMVRLKCDVALARLAAPKSRFKGLTGLFRK